MTSNNAVNMSSFSILVCNGYTIVCSHVRGDNPRALASGLSQVQADKPWYSRTSVARTLIASLPWLFRTRS